eukprot:gnl/TRDRNA2_/TRDRNA2_158283_c1_seq1.p1 gnl/TRDRNA2_/TRDRNA2_158283_c1~~gnl/TRDRNA2_/TRDRNA2_158283_c1_seq1.p1  ORF type:complete len:499 (+),score=88.65 gnl/TRDRNA2_/TRDRNA2_158283_c1_seq1:46-1542(+)
MTYGIKHFVGIAAWHNGDKSKRKGFFGTREPLTGAWSNEWAEYIYTCLLGSHLGHTLEFCVALSCYFLLYSDGTLLQEAKEWQVGWVARIICFNLACELVICNLWHYITYASQIAVSLKDVKFNPVNQYQPEGGKVGMFTSETGNLEREITFTTLGWLQSASWQCLFTHLWACEVLPCYTSFWASPYYSVLLMMGITAWREIHFYWCHRSMHPWWNRESGLLDGDIGAFLYRHVHSLHHKSYNPGPWSGLCMHPVEHLMYYSCATLPPLFLCVHPLHFLYAKFHADIAPVGGHDGHDEPSPNGDFHWLHHSKFECNYGVPWPVNFDKIFGTWVDYKEYKETGVIKANGEWSNANMRDAEAEDQANTEDSKEAKLLDEEAYEAISMEEVAKHSTKGDAWIVLYGRVINVTDFLEKHPGGEKVVLNQAGKDVTSVFESIHSSSGGFALVEKWNPNSTMGVVKDWDGPSPPSTAQAPSMKLKFPGALVFFPLFAASLWLQR